MTGMELAEQYWKCARSRICRSFPAVLPYITAGLAGEGSDCFGYDDEISRDHDWGPGFCIWLDKPLWEQFRSPLQKLYHSLPSPFMNYVRTESEENAGSRVGVLETGAFYRKFLGMEHAPESLYEWRYLPEEGMSAAVNGKIFFIGDAVRESAFLAARRRLLMYYPEDLRLKKLARHCALAAQAGQYNYYRCTERRDFMAAEMTLFHFTDEVQQIVFLLNRIYRPYYKWADRRMRELPALGQEISGRLQQILEDPMHAGERIEACCRILIAELKKQGLSDSSSDYLLEHGRRVQASVKDRQLREMHLMAE